MKTRVSLKYFVTDCRLFSTLPISALNCSKAVLILSDSNTLQNNNVPVFSILTTVFA